MIELSFVDVHFSAFKSPLRKLVKFANKGWISYFLQAGRMVAQQFKYFVNVVKA